MELSPWFTFSHGVVVCINYKDLKQNRAHKHSNITYYYILRILENNKGKLGKGLRRKRYLFFIEYYPIQVP